jgi:hypothetical protein
MFANHTTAPLGVPLAILPRHNHPLQPRLRIIAATAIVEDRDAEAAATIAMRTPRPKLQIKDKHTDKIAGHFVAFAPGIPQAHLKKPMSSSITAFGPTGTLPGFG